MLKPIIARDAFEKLAKELQAEYVEFDKLPKEVQESFPPGTTGKLVLSVEPLDGVALENVAGLKSGLAKERQERAALKAMVEKYGDLDPEKARSAIEQVKGMADWTPNEKAKAQLDHTVAQLNEKYKGEVEKRDGEIKSLYSQLEDALIEQAGTLALAEEKGNVDLLLPHVRKATVIRKDATTGKLVARILNPDGQSERITMKQGSQEPMSIREYVGAELKKRFPGGFGGTPATGSGAEGGPRGPGGPQPGQLSEQDARDPARYQAAREKAIKEGRSPESILPQRAA